MTGTIVRLGDRYRSRSHARTTPQVWRRDAAVSLFPEAVGCPDLGSLQIKPMALSM